MSTQPKTITSNVFCTRRVVWDRLEYEFIANLIKKYGCPVSKVSDGLDNDGDMWTAIYFDIPTTTIQQFKKEEGYPE